jgi:coenzyme F420-reducing hydrogenase delta subunit
MESDRIAMVNLSSAMGAQFAQVATEMTERIRKLGPNPLRHSRQAGAPDVPDASE